MAYRFFFTARKHLITRRQARHAIDKAVALVAVPPKQDDHVELWMFLGDDHTGRPLEVGAIPLDGGDWLVIHAMDLRPKYRVAYDLGRNDRQRRKEA